MKQIQFIKVIKQDKLCIALIKRCTFDATHCSTRISSNYMDFNNFSM